MLRRGRALLQAGLRSCRASSQAGWLETTSLRSPVPCSSPVQLRVLRQVTGLCRASQPWQQWPGWECRHTHASLQQRLAIAQQWRTVVTSKLKPKHVGGKRKMPTSFKERFKLMADGTIKRFRPGFRHKRTVKSSRQKHDLKHAVTVHPTYAKTLKRLGMNRRSFA